MPKMLLRSGLCLVTAIAAIGCAASPLSSNWPPPRSLGQDLPAYRPLQSTGNRPSGVADQASREIKLSGRPLALRDALAAALLRNPELAAHAWSVRVADARAMQAGLWPNPELELETEGFGRSEGSAGLKETETTLRLSQRIITAGEIGKRVEAAHQERALEAWGYEAKRLDVLTEVTQRHIDTLAARRRVAVSEQTLGLAEQVAEAVSQQVEAGEVSRIQRRRAEIEASANRIELTQAQRKLSEARAALAQAIGLVEPSFGEVRGKLMPAGQVPPLDGLRAAASENPAIAQWAAARARDDAELELAQAEAIPDFRVTSGLQRFNGDDEYAGILGLSVSLPIFDRNQGEVLRARFQRGRTEARRRAEVVRVQGELGQAYERLRSARAELNTLTQQTLPAARSTYRDIRTAYRQGQRPLLEMLDAQRTLFDLEAQHVDALASFHRTAAEIERLIGQPLDSLSSETTPDNPEREDTR